MISFRQALGFPKFEVNKFEVNAPFLCPWETDFLMISGGIKRKHSPEMYKFSTRVAT